MARIPPAALPMTGGEPMTSPDMGGMGGPPENMEQMPPQAAQPPIPTGQPRAGMIGTRHHQKFPSHVKKKKSR